MNFGLFKSRPVLPVAAVVLMAAAVCEAQPPNTNAWQSIIFSSPSNSETSSNLFYSPPDQSSLSPGFGGSFRLFQDSSPVTFGNFLPRGPEPGPAQMLRPKKSSDQSLDWEFMTPAQILGVSPDQVLQTQKRDGDNGQPSLTPTERFLERRNFSPRTDTNEAAGTSPWWKFRSDENDQTNEMPALFGSAFGDSTASTMFSQDSDTPQNYSPFGVGDSAWSKLFGTSIRKPVSTPVRQTESKDEFMQVLNPSFTPAAMASSAMPSSDETTFFKVQTVQPKFDSTTPLADPVGASFAPLKSGLGKPLDLAPLPTLTRQAGAQTVVPPAWAPQPPPWLSPTPQPFVIPQRKF